MSATSRSITFLSAQAGVALVFVVSVSTAAASLVDHKLGLVSLENERQGPHATASAAPNRRMSPGSCLYFPDDVDHRPGSFSPVSRLKPGQG